MSANEFDTVSDEFVICPHCGAEWSDPLEFFEGSGSEEVRTTCEKCGKRFIALAEYSAEFQTIQACLATYQDRGRQYECCLGVDHQSYRPHSDRGGVHWNDLGEHSTSHQANA